MRADYGHSVLPNHMSAL